MKCIQCEEAEAVLSGKYCTDRCRMAWKRAQHEPTEDELESAESIRMANLWRKYEQG